MGCSCQDATKGKNRIERSMAKIMQILKIYQAKGSYLRIWLSFIWRSVNRHQPERLQSCRGWGPQLVVYDCIHWRDYTKEGPSGPTLKEIVLWLGDQKVAVEMAWWRRLPPQVWRWASVVLEWLLKVDGEGWYNFKVVAAV